MDNELNVQLKALPRSAKDPLRALVLRVRAYIEKTQDPVFQQIVFSDAPAVVKDAVITLSEIVQEAKDRGDVPKKISPTAIATMLIGALSNASKWVAAAPDDADRAERLKAATHSVAELVKGLRVSTS